MAATLAGATASSTRDARRPRPASRAEKLPVQRLRRVARRDAELLPEPQAQILVRTECGRRVSRCREGLHEEAMPRLPKRLRLDQPPRDALGGRKLGSTHAEARRTVRLERASVQLAQPAPLVLDPWPLLADEEAALGDEEGDLRRCPRLGP